MRKYVVLYTASITPVERFAQVTREQAEQGMKRWLDWAAKLGDGLADMGLQLGHAMNVSKTGAAKSGSTIIGMSILQANSMDEALGMVQDHPHLDWADGAEIVVLEEMPIPELQG